jgi:hypothetical protein
MAILHWKGIGSTLLRNGTGAASPDARTRRRAGGQPTALGRPTAGDPSRRLIGNRSDLHKDLAFKRAQGSREVKRMLAVEGKKPLSGYVSSSIC